MLSSLGERDGAVIQQLNSDASQFSHEFADKVIWVEKQGGTYKI